MRKPLVKFGRVVFELCERTERQTNIHTDYNTSHPPRGGDEVITPEDSIRLNTTRFLNV